MSMALSSDHNAMMAEQAEELCFHCHSPLPLQEPAGGHPHILIDGHNRLLCCTSCLAAVQFIQELNLDSYYQYREQCGGTGAAANATVAPDEIQLQQAVQSIGDSKKRLNLLIPDLRCVACVWLLEQVLGKHPGVLDIGVNYATRRLQVDFDERTNASELARQINQLGYSARADLPDAARNAYAENRRSLLLRIGIAGIGMMQVMMFALASYLAQGEMESSLETLMRWASLALATPIVLYSAWPFHRGAWYAIKHRTLAMDVPVSLAILSAWVLSVFSTLTQGHEVYFDTATMFTFFLLLGRFAELVARHHFQQSQDLLLHLLPDSARKQDLIQNTFVSVAINSLQVGDVVQVLPGETVPADGIVVGGHSSVSEAAFTGEPLPLSKQAGARVLAGSINHDGDLLIEVTSTVDDSVLMQISRLNDQAANWRPQWAQLADRTSRWFVAAVLLISVGAGVFWYMAGSSSYFVIALTVLVVSCPCALSLATPVAYSVACTTLQRAGVVLRHGAFLERAAETTMVVFDKTGTLTEASVQVTGIDALQEISAQECFELASALEAISDHPIALAFDAPHTFVVEDALVFPGQGVQGRIGGHLYRVGLPAFALDQPDADPSMRVMLTRDFKPLANFQLHDRIRADAKTTVERLHSNGLQTALLTGDASMSADSIREQFGIDLVHTGLSAEDKVTLLRELQQHHRVMMVGDGVNDTAAMAAADTSFALSPRDSFVQNAADAVMVGNNTGTLAAVLALAKRSRRIIRQNIMWSICYNFSVIPLALVGLVPPWLAALGMSLSSLLVVGNAGRLRRMPS
jgi:P-type Cu2+ transporter